jgi:CDP-paratose 2-epimerase
VAKHVYGGKLSYIGYGGKGKQVRDFIHIEDLFDLIEIQINNFERFNKQTFNIGGGINMSMSLMELTKVCEEVTGNKIEINSISEERKSDLRWFITDSTKIESIIDWKPKKDLRETVKDIYNWIIENKEQLRPILS